MHPLVLCWIWPCADSDPMQTLAEWRLWSCAYSSPVLTSALCRLWPLCSLKYYADSGLIKIFGPVHILVLCRIRSCAESGPVQTLGSCAVSGMMQNLTSWRLWSCEDWSCADCDPVQTPVLCRLWSCADSNLCGFCSCAGYFCADSVPV